MTGYLDHAATTDVAPEALAAFVAATRHTGNPSALHSAGRAARKAVEDARAQVAESLGAHPSEVIFTSGGTESDNLAIKGSYWARRGENPQRTRIIISAVEHPAVSESAQWLAEHQAAELVTIPVNSAGVISLDALAADLAQHADATALVSVMWANHEVGAVQPIAEVTELARAHGIPVHTDAVQAVGQLPIDFHRSGVAALTVSGHKIGAPAAVGALLARRDLGLQPLLHGGGQERQVRSGTLDAPSIAGFAAAISAATSQVATRARHLSAMRDAIIDAVREAVPDAVLRGPDPAEPSASGDPLRLPANANFTFPGCEADSLLFLLDDAGIAASAGAACHAGVTRPSPVLLAMGVSESDARGAVRFSVGMSTTPEDVAALRAALPQVVARARAAAGY